MHRIDHTTADTTTSPGKNLFTEGNPALNTPATFVTDDWLNDVQENIIKVITQNGISLTKGRDQDLYDAIAAQISAGSGSQGNYANATILTSGATLTSADKGKYYQLNANNLTINLPNPSTTPAGSRFVISQGINTGGVVATPSGVVADLLASTSASSIALDNKSEYEFICVGAAGYHVFRTGGGHNLVNTAGYQRLPSGLIIQWAEWTMSVGAGAVVNQTVALPITFPNAGLCFFNNVKSGGSNSIAYYQANVKLNTLSQAEIGIYNEGGSSGSISGCIIVLGY